MTTIDQLLESVDLDFEPRFVTKDLGKYIEFWSEKPIQGITSWRTDTEGTILSSLGNSLKIAEFDGKDWTDCIYEVPRKTTGKIEPLKNRMNGSLIIPPMDNEVVEKINELVVAVNELKGAKNE